MTDAVLAGGVGSVLQQLVRKIIVPYSAHLDGSYSAHLTWKDNFKEWKDLVCLSVLKLVRAFPGTIPDTWDEFTTKLVTSTLDVLRSKTVDLTMSLEFIGRQSAADLINSLDFGKALTERWSRDNLLDDHQPPLRQQVYIYIYIYITMLLARSSSAFSPSFLYFWSCCDYMFISLLCVVGRKAPCSFYLRCKFSV
jgi:hypothetical protein